MNFYDAFVVMNDGMAKQEQIEEANKFLVLLLNDNPIQYLQNLIEIINNNEVPDKIRIGAIKSITVPLKVKGTNFNRMFLPDDIIQMTINALGVYLTYPREVSEDAARAFECYIHSSLSDQVTKDSLLNLLTLVSPERSPEDNEMFLRLMRRCIKGRWWSFDCNDIIFPLINFLSMPNLTQKSISYILKCITQIYKQYYSIENEGMNMELPTQIVDICWHFHEQFPKQSALLLSRVTETMQVVYRIPDFSENCFQCLQKSPYFAMLYRGRYMNETFAFFYDAHFNEILSIFFSIIQSDLENDPSKSDAVEQWNRPAHICRYLLFEIFQMRRDVVFEPFVQFITSHISEESTGDKYIAALLNYVLYCEYFPTDADSPQYTVDQGEVTNLLISDSNPYIHVEGLNLLSNRIYNSQIELNEDIIKIIFDDYMNDLNIVSSAGFRCLSAVCSYAPHELISSIIALMFDQLQYFDINAEEDVDESYVDDSDSSKSAIAKFKEHLADISKLCRLIPEPVAVAFVPDMIGQILNIDPNSIIYGQYIDILYELIKKSGNSMGQHLQTVIQILDSLLQSGREDDAFTLMSSLIETFGEQVGDIISVAVDKCLERIGSADNYENLSSIASLLANITQYIQDPDQLNHIVSSLMKYIVDDELKHDVLTSIYTIFYNISEINEDVIKAHAEEIFKLHRYTYFDFYMKQRPNAAKFALVLVSCVSPDNIPQNLVPIINNGLNSCINIVRNNTCDEETKSIAINYMLDLYEASSQLNLLNNVSVIYSYIYKEFDSRVPAERKDRFHELCPPPTEAVQQPIILCD